MDVKYFFHNKKKFRFTKVITACLILTLNHYTYAAVTPVKKSMDPPRAGGPLLGLSDNELAFFEQGLSQFSEIQSVIGAEPDTEVGLGPRFNLNSCAGCHAQPAIGGTSPAVNPQIDIATHFGATNTIPSFISINGPIREARFIKNPDGTPDGGVHNLFVISGRSDAPGCHIQQPDFANQQANNNIIFRIPTPLFGSGLIQNIPDATILANETSNLSLKKTLGISGHVNRDFNDVKMSQGHPNRNGNDGTITRFGWKAQNKSLLLFAGEAYNVEQGVTNPLFQNERDETPGCVFNPIPEDDTHFDETNTAAVPADIQQFAIFMQFLAPPTPAPSTPKSTLGAALFSSIGCAVCHKPSMQTAKSSTPALSEKTAQLYSDLLVHHMGTGLADGITQGLAGPDEFRTAPLWGVGQRLFFLHDGRATDLNTAILAHASTGSEANAVIANYQNLFVNQKSALIAFLQTL